MNRLSLITVLLAFFTHLQLWGLTCPVPDASGPSGKVIVNELSFNGDSANNDWLELYVKEGSWDLAGWQLILKSSGGNNSTVTLFTSSGPNTVLPWDTTVSAGRFMVFAETTLDSSISNAVAAGTLTLGTNLFLNSGIGLHNTIQEVLLIDNNGKLVYYFGYANKISQLSYDCVQKYPQYADLLISKGNNGQSCTAEDGVSSGSQSGDWVAGCNGTNSVGQSNNAGALLDHYQIEHNSSGEVGTPETIVVKACVNAACTELLSNSISASLYLTSGVGVITALTFTDGRASASLSVSSAQTVRLALRNTNPSGGFVCVDELGGNSCNINFTAPPVGGLCSDSFPDGLSAHGTGSVSFGYNAHLIGSPDNLLAASSLSKNGGSTINTCTSADCTTDPNGLLDAISPGTFQTTSSADDVTVAYLGSVTLGNTSNEYRNVISDSETTINFSAAYNEYRIDSLSVGYKGVVNLQANTVYWLNSFTMSSEAVINVVGSGTATIIVNASLQTSSLSLLNSAGINSSGDASKLAIYTYGNISLSDQSTISAIVYAKGSLTLGSASYIFGAATADNITLDGDSVMTYQSSKVNTAELGALCANSSSVDHYRINYIGDGITCEAKQMIIEACANETCDTLYKQQVIIDLAPTGWIDANGIANDSIVFTESAAISLSHTIAETVTIRKDSATPSAALTCNDGGPGSCDIAFANAAMQFFGNNIDEVILDQLAEQEFGANGAGQVNLRAVKDNNGVCVAALTGPQTVNLSYDCTAPDTCLRPLTFNGFGLSESTPTAVTLTFDNLGIAAFSSANSSALVYADAGIIALSADAVVAGATITTGSADIDVYPDRLVLFSSAVNTPFYTAGKGFDFSIQAQGFNGALLPNYQPQQLQFSVQRNTPTDLAASEGAFYYAGATGSSVSSRLLADFDDIGITFSSGAYMHSEAYFTEVGNFSLDAMDANYLGNVIDAEVTTLGDFIPAYFAVEIKDSIVPDVMDACDNFTYVGQTFNLMSDPMLTLTAKNHRGGATNNYSQTLWAYVPGDVSKAGNLEYTDGSGKAVIDDEGVISGTTKGSAVISDNGSFNGQGTLSITGTELAYIKPLTAINSFSASVDMTFAANFLTDSNGVCYQDTYPASGCSDFTVADINNIAGSEMRYGRLALENTYGPETEPLKVTVKAEYYDNNKWQLNPADRCTAINWDENSGDIVLTFINGNNNLLNNIDNVTSGGFLLDGINQDYDDLLLQKSATGPGLTGEIELHLDPDAFPSFLNIDWDGDGDVDVFDYPRARVSFGLYRGNDRVINWREVYN